MQKAGICIQIIPKQHTVGLQGLLVVSLGPGLQQCVSLADISAEFYSLSCQKRRKIGETFCSQSLIYVLGSNINELNLRFQLSIRQVGKARNDEWAAVAAKALAEPTEPGGAVRRRRFVKLQCATIKIRKHIEKLRLMFPWGCRL